MLSKLPPLIAAQPTIFTMFLKVKFMPLMRTMSQYIVNRSVFVYHLIISWAPMGEYVNELYINRSVFVYDLIISWAPQGEYVKVFNKGGVGRTVWNTDYR